MGSRKQDAVSLRIGGVVLCGGRSVRMGAAKATLPFGPETMLARVVRVLGQVVRPIVVVAAVGQDLPPLPGNVRVARDRRTAAGPLEGIAVGLAALTGDADAAYVTGCDVPRLLPQFVREVIARLEGWEIVVPVEEDRWFPLAGVYRLSVLPQAERLLQGGQSRLGLLCDVCRTGRISVADLRAVDPALQSLDNINDRASYERALAALQAEAGMEATDCD